VSDDLFEAFLSATRYLNLEQMQFSERSVEQVRLEEVRHGRFCSDGLAQSILDATAYLGVDAKALIDLSRNEIELDEVRTAARVRVTRHGHHGNKQSGFNAQFLSRLYTRARLPVPDDLPPDWDGPRRAA
jgi:hypothetical protein